LTIDLNKYRVNIIAIKNFLETRGTEELCLKATELAIALNCPVVVTSIFIKELVKEHSEMDELDRQIENLKKFYRITDIIYVWF